MTSDSTSRTAQQVLADGIAEAVALGGDMPLRWVAVVETLDDEGKRCMWRFGAEGMMAWDAISLLDFAIMKERAAFMRSEHE